MEIVGDSREHGHSVAGQQLARCIEDAARERPGVPLDLHVKEPTRHEENSEERLDEAWIASYS